MLCCYKFMVGVNDSGLGSNLGYAHRVRFFTSRFRCSTELTRAPLEVKQAKSRCKQSYRHVDSEVIE
jgi:hypothetical protein